MDTDAKSESNENDRSTEEPQEIADEMEEIVKEESDIEEENESLTKEKEEKDEPDLQNATGEESLCLNASSIQSEESMEDSVEEEKDSHNNSTLTTKRNRKKVERFVQETKTKDKDEEAVEIHGDGVTLGSVLYIEAMITKTSADDLRTLHRLFFNRPGTHFEVKRNIRKFNGFSLDKDKDDKEYEKKLKKLEKLTLTELRKILTILGLEKKGTKPEIVERILEFINCPVDKGQILPSKRKSKAKKPKKTKEPKEKKIKEAKKKKEIKGKPKKKKVEAEPVSDSDGDTSSESEAEPEPVKKTTVKKVVKPATQQASKKRKVDDVSSNSPAAKKNKKGPPTDAEIKTLVQSILAKANLEEVTMKKVCQQVYDSYPTHNLLPKKDFIKETVKSILS